jgi:HAD superfamily hydrolase (TIGR01549 family)
MISKIILKNISVRGNYYMKENDIEMDGSTGFGNIDIRAVIFDIDGTLVDTFEVYQRVFNQGIAQYGMAPVEQEILREYLAKGLGLRRILQNVFSGPIDDDTYATCREDILSRYKVAEIDEVKAFPGTEELLDHLHQKGMKIGIATGRTSSNEDEWTRFTRLGLDRYISAIVTSKEVEYRKPAPDVVIECARRLNVPTESCIVIGDTVGDIVAARKAGSMAAAVTTGHEDECLLLKESPDIVIHSLSEFAAYLERYL